MHEVTSRQLLLVSLQNGDGNNNDKWQEEKMQLLQQLDKLQHKDEQMLLQLQHQQEQLQHQEEQLQDLQKQVIS